MGLIRNLAPHDLVGSRGAILEGARTAAPWLCVIEGESRQHFGPPLPHGRTTRCARRARAADANFALDAPVKYINAVAVSPEATAASYSRIDFSRADAALMASRGRATSMSFFLY